MTSMLHWLTTDTHVPMWSFLLWIVAFLGMTFNCFRAYRTNGRVLHLNDQLIAERDNLRDANRSLRAFEDAYMRWELDRVGEP